MNHSIQSLHEDSLSRRDVLRGIGATIALAAVPGGLKAKSVSSGNDSLPMQFYKSLTETQRAAVCLPIDSPKRDFVSNWWYVHSQQKLHEFYTDDQRELVQQIFDSFHHEKHQEKMRKQVQKDLMGKVKNTPSVGFFGTPKDDDFEFIYTGHHVTRRCNAHTDKGLGFDGRPIFYGNFAKGFHEGKDHVGNPFWYQGLIFNEFLQTLSGKQRETILVGRQPRSEKPAEVIKKRKTDLPGLHCADLSKDQQVKLLKSMRRMLVFLRPDDVSATIKAIRKNRLMDKLWISCYGGKFDIGDDGVFDTWQIEGPDMVWYFRGFPHIHSYFHVAV